MEAAADREAQIQHYKPVYATLVAERVPIIPLDMQSKKPALGRVVKSIVSNAEVACDLLREGYNLGMVTYLHSLEGWNPLGVEVLDLDSDDHGLDLSPFNGLMTRREGEEVRCHLWFRRTHPDKARSGSRKGSKNAPEGAYDLMPWLVVLPGSVHHTGSLYELYTRKNGIWLPWEGHEALDLADLLPVVDPEGYRPVRDSSGLFEGYGNLEGLPFLMHPGGPEERSYAARNYIRGCIRHNIVSRSGAGGRGTLLKVSSHLMAYHRLPIDDAHRYLTEPLFERHWNKKAGKVVNPNWSEDAQAGVSRMPWNRHSWNGLCVYDKTGNPYPWSDEELLEGLTWGINSVPIYGVMRWEEEADKNYVKACLEHFIGSIRVLTKQVPSSGRTSSESLWRAFLDCYGLVPEQCSRQVFGVTLAEAIAEEALPLERKPATRKKKIYYQGISLPDPNDHREWVDMILDVSPVPRRPEKLIVGTHKLSEA